MAIFESLETADGESVWCDRIIVQSTYAGFLEGSPEGMSRRIREDGFKRIWSKYGVADPKWVHVVDPGTPGLPEMCAIAELASLPSDREYDHSGLFLIWFFDGPVGDVGERLKEQAGALRWRDHALDYYVG